VTKTVPCLKSIKVFSRPMGYENTAYRFVSHFMMHIDQNYRLSMNSWFSLQTEAMTMETLGHDAVYSMLVIFSRPWLHNANHDDVPWL
jgi:hypothetical protein